MTNNDYDLASFERDAKRAIEAFNKPKSSAASRRPPQVKRSPQVKGLRISLAVRTEQYISNDVFTHDSSTLSRVQAVIEAERAARAAGYTKIAHIIDVEKIEG